MKIIFACVHNAGRSQMAAAFFNAMTDGKIAEAISAGTRPSEHVNSDVVTVMKEIGIDLSKAKPKLLTDEMIAQADLLVTMGCGESCPYVPTLEREDWTLPDPKGKTLDEIRKISDEIKGKVEQLIKALKQRIPIKASMGIELIPTVQEGISKVLVTNPSARMTLSWDRFIRLNATANALEQVVNTNTKILDVGGYDGALALFLPDYQIDLTDLATNRTPFLDAPIRESSYETVVAVDVLEHIDPIERKQFLEQLCKIAQRCVILNYPHKDTKAAQELVFRATNNALIREHVQWELPDTKQVLDIMQSFGFTGQTRSYGSLAVWLGQYLILNLAPNVAPNLNRYLVDNHSKEPFSIPLYELLVCNKLNK